MENNLAETIIRVLKQRNSANRKLLERDEIKADKKMIAILGSAWRESDEIVDLIESIVNQAK